MLALTTAVPCCVCCSFDGSEDPAANASNRGDANTSRPRFDQRAEGRGGRGNNRTFDGAYGREAADNDRASQDGGRLQQGNAWQQDDAWQQGASWQGEDSWQQDESWGNRRQQLQPRQQRDGERWGNRRGRRGNRNDAEYSQGYLRNDSWGSQQQNLQQGGRQWQGQGGRDQDASGWQDSEFLSQGWEAGAGMEDDFQSDTWGASPSTRGNWRGKQERGVAGGGKRAGAGGDMLSTDMDDGEARDGTHRSWNDGQQRQGDGFDSQAMGDDWVFDDEGSAPLGGVPIQQEQQQQRQQRRGYRGR